MEEKKLGQGDKLLACYLISDGQEVGMASIREMIIAEGGCLAICSFPDRPDP